MRYWAGWSAPLAKARTASRNGRAAGGCPHAPFLLNGEPSGTPAAKTQRKSI
jgi:hypothetical protein